MIKSLLVIITIGITSYIFTDTDSDSLLLAGLLPLLVFCSLVSLGIWLVALFHKLGIDQYPKPDSFDTVGFSDLDGGSDGGDGGC